MESQKLIEIANDVENKSNKDLMIVADELNEEFEKMLSKIKPNIQSINLFAEILKNGFKGRNNTVRTELAKVQQDVAKQKQRLKNAKSMVLDGEITSADYKEMKVDIEEALLKFENDEAKLLSGIENYGHLIDDSLEIIKTVEKHYHIKDTVAKQRILSSIYPEKLIFEKTTYRTPKMLNVITLLCKYNGAYRGNKKGEETEKSISSPRVERAGFEPAIPLRVYKLSRLARSATLTPLLFTDK